MAKKEKDQDKINEKKLKKELKKVKTKKQKLNKKNKVKREKNIIEKGCFEMLFTQIKNIFDVKARATRREYYLSFIAKILFYIIYSVFFMVMQAKFNCNLYNMENLLMQENITTNLTSFTIPERILALVTLLFVVFNFITIITFVTLTARRFHDAGISSKTYFLSLICMIVFVSAGPILADMYPNIDSQKIYMICFGLPIILKIYIFVITLLSSDDDNKWGLNKYNIVKERKYRREKIQKILSEDTYEKENNKNEENKNDVNFSIRKVKTFNHNHTKEESLNKMDLLLKLNNGEITPEEYDKLNENIKSKK